MIILYLSITYSQYVELKDHLYYNGYHIIWHSQDKIEVDENDVDYVKTILRDRGIGFVE